MLIAFLRKFKFFISGRSNDDEERNDSWEVFRAVSTGDDLPQHLSNRMRPPIVHPKDLRIAYQEEFKELMSPIQNVGHASDH